MVFHDCRKFSELKVMHWIPSDKGKQTRKVQKNWCCMGSHYTQKSVNNLCMQLQQLLMLNYMSNCSRGLFWWDLFLLVFFLMKPAETAHFITEDRIDFFFFLILLTLDYLEVLFVRDLEQYDFKLRPLITPAVRQRQSSDTQQLIKPKKRNCCWPAVFQFSCF